MKTVDRKHAVMMAAMALAATLASPAPSVRAQPANGETVTQDFEGTETPWIKFGDNTVLGVSREPENVHEGTAALQFNYNLQKGNIAALALADVRPLASIGKLSFWAKSSMAGTMAFATQERGGGMWLALFHLPENQWQKVELTPNNFSTGVGPDDTPDPDNRLDLSKLEWAGLGDFGQFILGLPDPNLQKLFAVQPGARTLWLDDVTFEPGNAANIIDAAKPIVIDDFSQPQLNWLGLSGVEIERAEREVEENGAKTKRPGMTVNYSKGGGKITGLVRRVNSQGWAGANKISMLLASDNAAALGLQLEERGGGKYFVPITVGDGGEVKALSWSKAAFQPSPDSKDANGALDMDQVQQIMLIDLASFDLNAPQGSNSLWIGDVSAQK